ncbi:c-type cytochrome [Pusillimonas sp. TS35]|uniref:c-type cytochrome n=1 Tax=Paracandidimonas lactea TaxID=2895524 RepID=UPI00136BCDE5|nr:cytochrome c [Paracandidimonas lactea]MYN13074.1 c-type cytochrome [Pusillimonas sp. TS35]
MASKKWMILVAGLAVAGIALLLYTLLRDRGPAFIAPTDKAMVLRGKALYAANCASCHGEALQGQPNWRERLPNGRLPAPPHDKTGHTWHHPDAILIDIIKHGLVPGRTAPRGYQSDMPAYAGILSDDEIIAVLAYIKGTWPPAVLQAQKEVTLQSAQR